MDDGKRVARTTAFCSDYGLDWLVAPVGADVFLRDYWETEVLVALRDCPDYYDALLRIDDVDRVVSAMNLDGQAIQLVEAGQPIAVDRYCYPSGLVDAARVAQLFADGATIILPQLHMRVPALADLCRSMERRFGARFQTNVYFSPPGDAQGFKAHYDSHDVFVLQTAGHKAWRIYDVPVELPYRGQEFDPNGFTPGAVSREFVLRAGDLAYVPRGVVHDAVSDDEPSLHITLGALTRTWIDLLVEAVWQVGRQDPVFRRGLPVGFGDAAFDRGPARATFADLLRRLAENASFDTLLDGFADDLVSSRHGLLWGQIHQVRRLADMTLDSVAGVRPNLLYSIDRTDDGVAVSCYGNEVVLPVHAEAPLRHALEHRSFTVGDLPGDLDDQGKLVLVRRLVREGLVMVL